MFNNLQVNHFQKLGNKKGPLMCFPSTSISFHEPCMNLNTLDVSTSPSNMAEINPLGQKLWSKV